MHGRISPHLSEEREDGFTISRKTSQPPGGRDVNQLTDELQVFSLTGSPLNPVFWNMKGEGRASTRPLHALIPTPVFYSKEIVQESK